VIEVEEDEYTKEWKKFQKDVWAVVLKNRKERVCNRCGKSGVAIFRCNLCLECGEQLVKLS
jgi:anaerobic ribonucleoside-triphosphate reductase